MNHAGVAWASILISILSASPGILTPGFAATYQPGVASGDWVKYRYVDAAWESNVPGMTPPPEIVLFQGTE